MEGVCNSAGWVAHGEGEGAYGSSEAVGTEEVAESSWNHSQTVHVSRAVVGIVGNPGVEAGFGGGEVVGENTAVSGGLGGVAVVAGIVERAAVQGHEECKVGADRWLVVDIVDTVVWEGGEGDGLLVVDVEIGKAVAGVGVAAAASGIGYHHNRSSRTKQTAQQEDAVAGLAEAGSIVS